jgi:hypothetical protein
MLPLHDCGFHPESIWDEAVPSSHQQSETRFQTLSHRKNHNEEQSRRVRHQGHRATEEWRVFWMRRESNRRREHSQTLLFFRRWANRASRVTQMRLGGPQENPTCAKSAFCPENPAARPKPIAFRYIAKVLWMPYLGLHSEAPS